MSLFTGNLRTFATATSALALALTATSVASRAQDVTVEMWLHEHPPRLQLDKDIIAAFTEEHPNIQIDLSVVPTAQFDSKLLVALASGAGPDLFNQSSLALGQFYASDILDPIDLGATTVDSQAGLSDRFGVGLNGVTFDDVVYGLPTEVSNYACVANGDLWKEAGLDPAVDAPTTWEEMVAVAETLTQRDDNGVPTRRGFDFNWSAPIFMWLIFNSMVDQAGGQLVDEIDYTAKMNSPEVEKVLQFWVDWVNEHKLGGPQYTASRDAFLAGELATECSFGSWGKGQFESAGIDYTFFPAPRWEDNAVDTGFNSYGYFLMVNARSPEEERSAAWKFAEFYASHAEELYEQAGLFTTAPEVTELESYKSDSDNEIFRTELEKARYTPRIAGFNEIGDALARARDRAVIGGEDVSAVLNDLNTEATEILKREQESAGAN